MLKYLIVYTVHSRTYSIILGLPSLPQDDKELKSLKKMVTEHKSYKVTFDPCEDTSMEKLPEITNIVPMNEKAQK